MSMRTVTQYTNTDNLTLTIMFLQFGCHLSAGLDSSWPGSFLIEVLSPNTQQTKTQQGPAQCVTHDCHSCKNNNICVYKLVQNISKSHFIINQNTEIRHYSLHEENAALNITALWYYFEDSFHFPPEFLITTMHLYIYIYSTLWQWCTLQTMLGSN